jgi:hypothetical protein
VSYPYHPGAHFFLETVPRKVIMSDPYYNNQYPPQGGQYYAQSPRQDYRGSQSGPDSYGRASYGSIPPAVSQASSSLFQAIASPLTVTRVDIPISRRETNNTAAHPFHRICRFKSTIQEDTLSLPTTIITITMVAMRVTTLPRQVIGPAQETRAVGRRRKAIMLRSPLAQPYLEAPWEVCSSNALRTLLTAIY